jgi:peptide/nickel transport system permease protein
LREHLDLDRPAIVQFGHWFNDLIHGDLGRSFRTGDSVLGSLLHAFPVTAELSLLAFCLAVGFSIPLGALAALRRGGVADHATRVFALGGASMPTFWFGYLLIILFAVKLRIFPTEGTESPISYVLPAITLSLFDVGLMLRLTRASVLEVLGEDFVLAARARGIPRFRITTRHVLRVALNPVVTYAGLLIGGLLGGSVIVETVFGMPGIGKLVVDAINDRDFPLVQGFVLFFGTAILLINLLVDLFYVVLDPRVRLVETKEVNVGAT